MISKLYYTLFLCMIFQILSCGGPRGKNNYTGRYILDHEESDLDIYKDSTQYHQLVLEINADSTYEFSKEVPFIKEKKGRYGCEVRTGLIYDRYYECFLVDEQTGSKETIMDESNISISFRSLVTKEEDKQIVKLCFRKI